MRLAARTGLVATDAVEAADVAQAEEKAAKEKDGGEDSTIFLCVYLRAASPARHSSLLNRRHL